MGGTYEVSFCLKEFRMSHFLRFALFVPLVIVFLENAPPVHAQEVGEKTSDPVFSGPQVSTLR